MDIIPNLSHRQSLIQTGGTVVNSLLGLGFYILVARNLGLTDFGHFSFLLGLGLLAAELGDLGFSAALVKFTKEIGFAPVFATVVIQRILVALVLFLIFSFFSFFPALVATALLFFSLTSQALIARQKYFAFAGANVAGNLARLVLTGWLATVGGLSIQNSLLLFCLGAGLSTIVALWFLFSSFDYSTLSGKAIISAARQMIPFVRYLAVSFGIASLSAKIDIPLVYAIAGPTGAGIYSSAQKLTSVIPQVAANVEGVFSPKFSSGESFGKHFRDYRNIIIFFSVTLLAGVLFAGPLTSIIYGEKFSLSVPVLQILLLASAIFLLVGPYSTAVVYRFSKSAYHLMASGVQLFVVVALFFILIPPLSSVGAAIATLFGNLALLAVFVFLKEKLNHD